MKKCHFGIFFSLKILIITKEELPHYVKKNPRPLLSIPFWMRKIIHKI